MIRCIAALDAKRGLATNNGIPWKLPTDSKFFSAQTATGIILMGSSTYKEFAKPLHGRTNYVATRSTAALRQGFEAVHDIEAFFMSHVHEQIQDIGGASLFAQTLPYAHELVLTQIQADFHCTKFFPEYEDVFACVDRSEPVTENDVSFCFETWHRKPSKR